MQRVWPWVGHGARWRPCKSCIGAVATPMAIKRWSRKFVPVVKVGRVMKVRPRSRLKRSARR